MREQTHTEFLDEQQLIAWLEAQSLFLGPSTWDERRERVRALIIERDIAQRRCPGRRRTFSQAFAVAYSCPLTSTEVA